MNLANLRHVKRQVCLASGSVVTECLGTEPIGVQLLNPVHGRKKALVSPVRNAKSNQRSKFHSQLRISLCFQHGLGLWFQRTIAFYLVPRADRTNRVQLSGNTDLFSTRVSMVNPDWTGVAQFRANILMWSSMRAHSGEHNHIFEVIRHGLQYYTV